MTTEKLKAQLQAIPTPDLLKQARPALQRLIEGKGRLCIPAQPYDDDMVLSEALDRLEAQQVRVETLEAENEHLREEVSTCIAWESPSIVHDVAPVERRQEDAAKRVAERKQKYWKEGDQ